MMRLPVLRVLSPLVVAVALFIGACASYEPSDRPICGDRLLPAGDACALWPAPCGCAKNQRCGYDGNAFACMAPGAGAIDATCASDAECAANTICDGTRCRKACFEALDCGNDAAVECLRYDDANGNQIAGSCHRDCDPVTPAAPVDPRLETCASAETCALDPSSSIPSCARSTGAFTVGAVCKNTSDCVAGSLCTVSDASGKAHCIKLCWVGGDAVCPSGKTCNPLNVANGPLLGQYVFGACQ